MRPVGPPVYQPTVMWFSRPRQAKHGTVGGTSPSLLWMHPWPPSFGGHRLTVTDSAEAEFSIGDGAGLRVSHCCCLGSVQKLFKRRLPIPGTFGCVERQRRIKGSGPNVLCDSATGKSPIIVEVFLR